MEQEPKTFKSSFVTQAAILAGAGIFARFLGFLYRVPLTNMIGNEGNSIYSVGFTFYSYFLVMSSAGIPTAISKLVSERRAIGRHDEAHSVFKAAMLLSGALGFACMLIILFGAGWLTDLVQRPLSKNALLTLAPTVFIVSIMAVFRGYFQGMGSTIPTALSQVVEQIFNAVFSVMLAAVFINAAKAKNPLDVIGFKAAGAAGGTTGTGIGALAGLLFIGAFYLLMRPLIHESIRKVNRRLAKQPLPSIMGDILKISIPIVAGTAVFSITNIIDLAMVKSRLIQSGITDNIMIENLYGQLQGKFVLMTNLPVAISASLSIAAIPSIAASKKRGNEQEVNSKINASLRVAMFVSTPAAFGMGVLADPIVQLLFPNSSDGGNLLMFGFSAIIFLALTQILTGMLQAVGKVYIPVFAALAGAVVKIAINYFLVGNPKIGISGAVFGTIFCYTVTSVINWFFLSKVTLTRPDIVGIMIKPIVSSIAMALGCYVIYNLVHYALPSNTLAIVVSMLTGVLTYFFFMVLIKGFSENDMRMIPYGRKITSFLSGSRMI